MIEIGSPPYGATVGIVDFSTKSSSTFGQASVVERAYSKRASMSLLAEKARFNKTFRTLASLRATPRVYIGTDVHGYEPLIVYGYYRDFSIDVAYSLHHLCLLPFLRPHVQRFDDDAELRIRGRHRHADAFQRAGDVVTRVGSRGCRHHPTMRCTGVLTQPNLRRLSG